MSTALTRPGRVAARAPRPAPATSASAPAAPAAARPLPAWPVLVLLWGMPVWWALGMLPFASVVMALPMAALLTLRRVSVPPGIMPWIAFVVWMVPCALMLDSMGRMIGFGVRFAQFASIAVILLYVVSAATTLTLRRIVAGLTFTWVFVILGGWLGVLWPEITLTQTIGQLLPSAIRENEYVSDLVFPPFAEVQTPWGAEEPFVRPSAPYAYTNGWGAAMAILTPVAVANAALRRSSRSVLVVVLGSLAAVPPAIASSNRGLFVGVAIAVAYVLVRALARGALAQVLAVAILAAGMALLLVLSGFAAAIVNRQETVDTTEGRSLLYEETLRRTLESPVLGWGAPRPSTWSEISVGTQGMVWNAMFCFGFVGLALLLWFLVGGIARTWGVPDDTGLWLHASVVAALAMSTYYGLDRHMLTIGLVLAVLLRERADPASAWWHGPRAIPEAGGSRA
ncbi:O-antigen ligase domain-containing protein [Homoserinibacter sp. YIM 151385]|uniref:O-antigen ligase domain-containing protein n=1 Tax=Homoserinibacter sp. YIM 151385 TaxID=2985506 RepID=UPI0022F0E108|nr:O-antigen ligase domain-containing protein [Homoserinibacter sp. YIM 151385]WBU38831.1 O-antigen ligase domain-containing protein [Homoserinibacter sp. YIM 151385]